MTTEKEVDTHPRGPPGNLLPTKNPVLLTQLRNTPQNPPPIQREEDRNPSQLFM